MRYAVYVFSIVGDEIEFAVASPENLDNYHFKLHSLTDKIPNDLDGFSRDLVMRSFNLAVLQPHLVGDGERGGRMQYHEVRRPDNLFMKEVVYLLLDYPEIHDRMGISYEDIMGMERPYYLEWRKLVTERLNEERTRENDRQAEIAAKNLRDKTMSELERIKRESAKQQRVLRPHAR